MEYKIMVIEQLGATITVQADDVDDALDKARSMYRNCDIVLTAEDYISTDFSLVGDEMELDAELPCDKKCKCGSESFAAQQIGYHHVVVTGESVFEVDTYKGGVPYGPFICIKCGAVYKRGEADNAVPTP